MTMRAPKAGLLLSACALVLALGGCGGGGGGGVQPIPAPIGAPPPSPPPPPPPPPPPAPASTFVADAEYQRSNAATAHGAITAYRAGATGAGIKVGVIDSGINPDLAEFRGKIDPASRDIASNRGIADAEGHGTAVSSVIAAARNGSQYQGVAFDAAIISLNTANPNNCDEDDGCKHSDRDIATAIDVARTNGAKVINISLGGEGVGSAVLSAAARATSAGIVIVMSAGNDEALNPTDFASTIASRSGNGAVIIAGAHDSARQMASFSNEAGSSAATYLTALGVRVNAIDEQGRSTMWSGTSFSAPVISGAAALLASAFPNLSGRQIVDILLSSADDAGEAGTDAVYGRGILNITRAFEPRGTLTLAGTSAVVTFGEAGTTSAASGDAGITGATTGAIILDGYSRAYTADLAASLAQAVQEQPLRDAIGGDYATSAVARGPVAVQMTVQRRSAAPSLPDLARLELREQEMRDARAVAGMAIAQLSPDTVVALGLSTGARSLEQRLEGSIGSAFLVARDPGQRLGFRADPATSLAVRHDFGGFTLTGSAERGAVMSWSLTGRLDDPAYTAMSMNVARRVGPALLGIGASLLDEEETILGGRYAQSFLSGGAQSLFVDGTADLDLGHGFALGARYRRGWTHAHTNGGLVESGRLASEAFSLDLAKTFGGGDRLALRIAQPLRVAAGGFALGVPVSYDYATGAVGYEDRFLNLAPTGREVDYELGYGRALGSGWIGMNLFARTDPGHVEAMNTDMGGAIRFTTRFR